MDSEDSPAFGVTGVVYIYLYFFQVSFEIKLLLHTCTSIVLRRPLPSNTECEDPDMSRQFKKNKFKVDFYIGALISHVFQIRH